MSALHSSLMRVKYSEIQFRSCWHLARLLHRVTYASFTSEMLAEHAGSVLRYIERKHGCGRSLKLPALIDAVSLRIHGITGGVDTIPFLRAVVSQHFGKDNEPHFFLRADYRRKLAGQDDEKTLLGPSAAMRTLRVS